ncbi:MAG: hypothetical protein HYR94_17940 [Chloroflexi bacterium]|nr:hypothetical protein [Chloroflexota bacterium]
MIRLKRALILIFKILLTVLISFLTLELLLLIFNDFVFQRSFFMYDPDIGFKVRPHLGVPGYGQTNEFGFNDRDYPHQKAPGVYRILILSDSFNWAGGMEGNYTAILERKLQAKFGDRVEVINAGYASTHTGEELEILKKFGVQYNPDLVILGFFVGNDFLDAHPMRRRIVVGNLPVDIWGSKEMTLFGQPLVFQSRLYLFLQERWATFQLESAQAQQQTLAATSPPASTEWSDWYLELEFGRMKVANWAETGWFQFSEPYVFESLLAMRHLLAARHTEFMVVTYPDEFQVDKALRQAVIDKYRLDPSTYQWNKPQFLLREFCAKHEIAFYDMLPTFRQAHQQGQRLYLPNDSHWNEAGNELAAQYLFDLLLKYSTFVLGTS